MSTDVSDKERVQPPAAGTLRVVENKEVSVANV